MLKCEDYNHTTEIVEIDIFDRYRIIQYNYAAEFMFCDHLDNFPITSTMENFQCPKNWMIA